MNKMQLNQAQHTAHFVRWTRASYACTRLCGRRYGLVMKNLILSTIIFLSFITSNSYANEKCPKIDATLGISQATIECFREELKVVFNSASEKLTHDESKLALKISQEKWAAWVQAECSFKAIPSIGLTGLEISLDCEKSMTLDRMYVLKQIPACEFDGCP